MTAEELGYGGENAELCCGGEPVAFAGEELHLVGHGETVEEGVQFCGLHDGDDGVLVAVEDECGREGGGGLGGVGLGEAAGDLDDGFDVFGGGGCGEGQEGSQRDAEEGDAVGIDAGPGGDVSEGVRDGGEPERDVVAVAKGSGVGPCGSGAIEVMHGVTGDAEAGELGSEPVEPEGVVSA